MKLGLVIPVAAENGQRLRWAEASLRSLCRTLMGKEQSMVTLFVVKNMSGMLSPFIRSVLSRSYSVEQPFNAKSIDSCNIWGWHKIIEDSPDVTHLAMGTVDWIYHPRWYRELEALVSRHPSARSWWVYRSAFEQYHKTLKVDGDVMVRSINAGGCFPADDFRKWNPDYREFRLDPPRVTWAEYDETSGLMCYESNGSRINLRRGDTGPDSMVPVNRGLTLDLYDPWFRQGERWVTKRSWILNIGIEGENQHLDAPEYAVDWVGL